MRDGTNGGGLWIGLAVVLGLALGALAGWFARDFFAVNACLEMGGAWTAPGVCVGAPPR
jgi:hypothetical protein